MFLFPLISLCTDIGLRRRFSLCFPFSLAFSLFAYAMLTVRFHTDYINIMKGMFLVQCLIPVSYIDVKTHEIPDCVYIFLLLDGLIQINITDAIAGLGIASMPCLLFAILSSGGIGGGDVKLFAACGFVLGSAGIFFGAAAGMTLYCIAHIHVFFQKTKPADRYALAPYISAGCFIAYLLIC